MGGDDGYMELVWENGQILVRGLSSTSTSPFKHKHMSSEDQPKPMPMKETQLLKAENKPQTKHLMAASSVCSRKPSNQTKPSSSKRKYQEIKESAAYTTDDYDEGETEDVKETQVPSIGASCSKRTNRTPQVHNLSERKRKDKINKKMRVLQQLIPNCTKLDKVSVLDMAIEYLKTLQLQLRIMVMGSGMYMAPFMLPTGLQSMGLCAPFIGMGIPSQYFPPHPLHAMEGLNGAAVVQNQMVGFPFSESAFKNQSST